MFATTVLLRLRSWPFGVTSSVRRSQPNASAEGAIFESERKTGNEAARPWIALPGLDSLHHSAADTSDGWQ